MKYFIIIFATAIYIGFFSATWEEPIKEHPVEPTIIPDGYTGEWDWDAHKINYRPIHPMPKDTMKRISPDSIHYDIIQEMTDAFQTYQDK